VDTHFGQSLADRGGIAGVSFGQPFNPFIYESLTGQVIEFFKLLFENISLVYLSHGHNVNYRLHIVNRFFRENQIFLWGYFMSFFGLAASSGLALGGRPFPGTLRMASKAEAGYIASFVRGLIPAVSRRFLIVLSFSPNLSAISEAVNPFTPLLSVNIVKKPLNTCLDKIYKIFRFLTIFYIDINIVNKLHLI
jgi:hypothetical protein